MDNIVKHIYKSCDPNNTDSVPASSLIDFIKPYMPDNLSELQELQTQLDPDGSDLVINSSFFYQAMSDWIAKIEKKDPNNSFSELPHKSFGAVEDADFSPFHTAIYSIGLSPNMSRISNASNTNNNSIIDHITLHEEVQRLQHQLHKTVNELDLVKQQLAVSEEQNESLLADLNKLHKLHFREQQIVEEINKNKQENDEIKEEANAANKKIQHLAKVLGNYEKEREHFLSQITQLENENSYLKTKMQKYEKTKVEGRRSISEIRDELEIKESEISTLMEIIDELKLKVDEQTELVNFYTNENKLFKQKALALENLLHDILPEGDPSLLKSQEGSQSLKVFNTPKLMRQIAHPISPNMSTPIITPKTCNTSSPIKTFNNNCIDLFSSGGIVTVLRSPHKTLKEELSEANRDKSGDSDEVKRLQDVLKEQELIKNSLWENMKHLSNDNELLQDYKKGYRGLVLNIQEKEEEIERLKDELESSQKQFLSYNKSKELNCSQAGDKITETDFCQKEDKAIEKTEICSEQDQLVERLKSELNQQKLLLADLSKELEIEKNKDHKQHKQNKSTETDLWQERDELIQRLTNDLEVLEARLNHEKLLNAELKRKYEKIVVDKCVETNRDDFIWGLQLPVSEIADSKKTNFGKQQLKLERLLEKHEKVEKDLTNERGINTTLSLKLQEMREESRQMKDDLEFHREKNIKQTDIIRTLLNDKHNLEENLGILEMENNSLQKENLNLKDEKRSLTNEKHALHQSLQNSLNRLAIEASVTNSVRAENELLLKKQRQIELKLKDECIRQIHLKKQAIDLRTTSNLKIIQLEKNLAEKENEIEKLRKQIEVINIEVFLSVNNKELGRTTSEILNQFKTKFEHELDHDLIKEIESLPIEANFDLEKQMVMINNNVKLAVQLLEIMAGKYSHLLEHNPSETQSGGATYCVAESLSSSSIDDFYDSYIEPSTGSVSESDTFISCLSEISVNVGECMELIPFECDSFLDNLELGNEDLRELSMKEMEEKFSTLALTLTMDFTTSDSRYLSQKEKCNRLLIKFFTYLNYSTDLIRRLNRSEQSSIHKTAITYLQLLKNISEDVFKAAVQCGVLQYEKRTVNCWNLVINYVAALSQESKLIKQTKDFISQGTTALASISKRDSEIEKSVDPLTFLHPHDSSNVLRRIKICVYSFFFVLFTFLVMLVFYVDYLCPKDGRRICPLEWILSCFVKKIHSHHIL